MADEVRRRQADGEEVGRRSAAELKLLGQRRRPLGIGPIRWPRTSQAIQVFAWARGPPRRVFAPRLSAEAFAWPMAARLRPFVLPRERQRHAALCGITHGP